MVRHRNRHPTRARTCAKRGKRTRNPFPHVKTLNGIWRYVCAVAPAAGKAPLDLLYAYRGRNVERFLLTIGYNRSGSSLLGQLLNAHPEMAVAHELYILQRFRDLRLVPTPSWRGRATRLILERDRVFERQRARRNSGYSYAMDGLWQGKYSRLRLLGDKGATNVAKLLGTHGLDELDQLRRRVRAPVKFLFTIRNPYDVLASRRLGRLRAADGVVVPSLRDYAPACAERVAISATDLRWFLDVSENLSRIFAALPAQDVLPIRYEEFIAAPQEKLRDICAFLGMTRDDAWLNACAEFTLSTPHPTRRKARWSDDHIAQVAVATRKYSWLAGYEFQG